jgi:GNAT superfamily N-acetyltransferase
VKFAKARPRDVPSGYPSELEQLRTLADGREVFVRPIVPADLDALREAIANADPQTIHDRFLGGRPPTDDQTLRHLTTVDYLHRLAIVAFDRRGRGVAIARYEGTANTDHAEVAVVVDPAWRRIGLASALLRMLADAALKRGITRFSATSYADNIDVQDILARSGLPHTRTGAGPVVDDVIDLVAAPSDTMPSPRKSRRPADPTSLT